MDSIKNGWPKPPVFFRTVLAEETAAHGAITTEADQDQNPDDVASTSVATVAGIAAHDTITVAAEEQDQDQPETTIVVVALTAASTSATYTTTVGCC